MTYQTLSEAGPSTPIAIPINSFPLASVAACVVEPGSQLSYTLEATIDPIGSDGTFPAGAIWFPLNADKTGLGATDIETVQGAYAGVRANVTSYTSGALMFGCRTPMALRFI